MWRSARRTIPRFSLSGRRLAFTNESDIYVYDLERARTSRLTFTGSARAPAWAPDGNHVVFGEPASGLFWMRADGAGAPQHLLKGKTFLSPWSFSPNGRRLAYIEQDPEMARDIWTLPLDLTDPDHPKPGEPELFLRTPKDELLPSFSPDGRWIAYRSNESENNEIWVRPFPASREGKWQISSGGGLYPFWSKNGRELFYETADNRIMVVDYTVNGASFDAGRARPWVDKELFYPGALNLDLAPEGKCFAVFTLPERTSGEKGSVHVTMLLNFRRGKAADSLICLERECHFTSDPLRPAKPVSRGHKGSLDALSATNGRARQVNANGISIVRQMRQVFLVVRARSIQQICVRRQILFYQHRKRLRIGLGIVHRDLDFQPSEGGSAETFSHFGGIG